MKQFFYLLPLICALLVVGPIEAKKKKYPNGNYYEGEWVKGAPHGIGTMKYADGSVYEGNWKLGKRNGQGIMKYANGDVYEGNWKLGEKNGQGTMKYVDGSIYIGKWQNGNKHGAGSMSSNAFKAFIETGEWNNDKLYNGKSIKESQLGQLITEYKAGSGEKTIIKNNIGGWEFNGEISHNNLPLSGTIIKNNNKILIKNTSGDYIGTIVFKNDSTEIEKIPSPNEVIDFKNWVTSAFSKIENTNKHIDYIAMQKQKKIELQREKEEAERKARQKAQEEEEKARIEEQKARIEVIKRTRMAAQIPYYIWEATDIRSAYENNPARFRTLTQNKYVIIGGTIADIDESKNFEYSPIWQDWVEYKYYTIRLSGGIYFESRNTEFVSKLNRGQELLFVGLYTDKQSFNRPLFDLIMYASSTQGITKLMLDNGISLSSLVKRR